MYIWENPSAMKKILLTVSLFIGITLFAQTPQPSANTCANAQSLCSSVGIPFLNTTGVPLSAAGPDYNCLSTTPNPFWFIIPVSQSGDLHFTITQANLAGAPIDVDFITYGPFTEGLRNCSSLSADKVKSCSYSAAAVESVNIPNVNQGEYYVMMVTNFSNQMGYITITDTMSTAQIDCQGFRMQAFLDDNSNGVKDASEINFFLGTFTVEENNSGVVHNVADTDGIVNVYDVVATNTYDFTFSVLPEYAPYFQVNSAGYQNVPVNSAANFQTYYFPVTAVSTFTDMRVNIIPLSPPRPGFTFKNKILLTNLSTTPKSGILTFTKDPLTQITNTFGTVVTTTPAGFDYSYQNLAPLSSTAIDVEMALPASVTSGTLLTTTASTDILADEISPLNNTASSVQTVVASYDPNDKTEAHGRQIVSSQFAAGDYLYYMVRFQNTGTTYAEFVTLTDQLDSQLNAGTLEVIRSSHPYTMDRVGSLVTWRFDNIFLNPESIDEPGSHGYIYFRVKPLVTTPGTVIPNNVNIYFDYNPAVTTNTWQTEFVTALGNQAFASDSFMLYPNPAKSRITIEGGNVMLQSARIYDITGKLVAVKDKISSTSATIDVAGLASGAYFTEITSTAGERIVKKLIIK